MLYPITSRDTIHCIRCWIYLEVVIIRLIIDESEEHDDIEIIIKCKQIDKRVRRIIEQIKQREIMLTGKKNGKIHPLVAEDLFYFESVDNKVFLYDEKEVFESDLKLYELEQITEGIDFIRISKSLIINISHIENVRALFNGKFEAALTNGEKIIINRHYVKKFKEKFLS